MVHIEEAAKKEYTTTFNGFVKLCFAFVESKDSCCKRFRTSNLVGIYTLTG